MNFSFDNVYDKIHTHKACPIVRVYLESVVWASSSMKMFDDNMDTLVAHWFQLTMVLAFVIEYCCVATMLTMLAKSLRSVNLSEI
jgi:hypothetical protein